MTESTREKLLDVAEVLIAKNGIGNTSLRQIVKEAGVNIAAVNYHFGSKDDLMIAVYRRHFIPVNEERIKRLDELEAEYSDEPVPLEKLLDAFMMPVYRGKLRFRATGGHNVLLFSRLHTEAPELRTKILNTFSDVLTRFIKAFNTTLPDLQPGEIFFRMKCSMGILMALATEPPELAKMSIAASEQLSGDKLTASLLAYAAAGFRSLPPANNYQGDT